MNDDCYYAYLPRIENYVRKWATPDRDLRFGIPELIEDARSFAYLHWATTKKRFPDDPEAAGRYYNATVTLKLDSYLNRFYKHEIWIRQNDQSVRHNVPQVHLDTAVGWDGTGTIAETALLCGLPQLVTLPQLWEEPSRTADLLRKFAEEAQGKDREIVELALENALVHLDSHPDKPVARSSGAFDFASVGEKVGMTQKSTMNRWGAYRREFLGRHPEVLAVLHHEGDEV